MVRLGGKNSMVANVFCGENSTFAVCMDGSVFAWGDNQHGQLGVGTYDDESGEWSPHHLGVVKKRTNVTTGEDSFGKNKKTQSSPNRNLNIFPLPVEINGPLF